MRKPISKEEMDFLIKLSNSKHPDMNIFIEDMLDYFYKKSDKERHDIFSDNVDNPSVKTQNNNHFSFLEKIEKTGIVTVSRYDLVILKNQTYYPWVIAYFNGRWMRGDFSAMPYEYVNFLTNEDLKKRKASLRSFKFSDIIIPACELSAPSRYIEDYMIAKTKFMNNINNVSKL